MAQRTPKSEHRRGGTISEVSHLTNSGYDPPRSNRETGPLRPCGGVRASKTPTRPPPLEGPPTPIAPQRERRYQFPGAPGLHAPPLRLRRFPETHPRAPRRPLTSTCMGASGGGRNPGGESPPENGGSWSYPTPNSRYEGGGRRSPQSAWSLTPRLRQAP